MQTMKLLRALAVLLISVAAGTALAADPAYPSREIRFIVPWAAGGATDVATRALGRVLADEGFRLIVENVPGNTAQIGLAKVAGAAPDGYTLGMGTSSTLALAGQGLTVLKPGQFTAIAVASVDPLLLLVPANGPATLEAFLAHMKKNPGKVSIATPGNNNVNHLFAVMTARAAGTEFINVPYQGGARVITDLAGKQVDAAVLKPSESRTQIEAGLVKPIAVFAQERLSFYPAVPTFKEKGFDVFPYGSVSQLSYVVAPAGLPAPVREKLVAVFRKAIQSPQYKAFAAQSGYFVEDVTGGELDKQLVQMQKAFDVVGAKVFKQN